MKDFILEFGIHLKTHGVRKTAKHYGYKFFIIVFLYYLIRDSILYIFIPYVVINGLF